MLPRSSSKGWYNIYLIGTKLPFMFRLVSWFTYNIRAQIASSYSCLYLSTSKQRACELGAETDNATAMFTSSDSKQLVARSTKNSYIRYSRYTFIYLQIRVHTYLESRQPYLPARAAWSRVVHFSSIALCRINNLPIVLLACNKLNIKHKIYVQQLHL